MQLNVNKCYRMTGTLTILKYLKSESKHIKLFFMIYWIEKILTLIMFENCVV